MKLRAVFEIEVDAADYVAAADFQRRMTDLLKAIRRDYATADLAMQERRPRAVFARRSRGSGPASRARQRNASARIAYEDL